MPDDHARDRIRRAVDESARDNDDQRGHQRNTGVAILVLALVVAGLLIAMVMGGLPRT